MGTLREKNVELGAVITGVLEKVQSFENYIIKDLNGKTYLFLISDFLKSVEVITEGLLKIDTISQENKSVYYRFVPLDKDLFKEEGKSKFRDQYHKLDNFLHASLFEIKTLKEYSWDITIEKKNILTSIASIKNCVVNIGKLSKEISEVAGQFVNLDKDLFEIISEMKAENKVFKVLVVDDVAGVLFAAKRFLDNRGFTTFTAEKVDEAIKSVKENSPDIIILDLNLESNMDGSKVLKFIRENNLPIKCIVCTVVDDEERLATLSVLKPDKILVKPFDNNQLFTQINAVIKVSRI